MDGNDQFYKNLVVLLKMFKNRPYHLAKYLVDNKAFGLEFKKKVELSSKLREISRDAADLDVPIPISINDISKMIDFYDTLIDELSQIETKKSHDEIEQELNKKLDNLIKDEKFEEASKVRDYMQRNGVKRINKF
jgi:cysteinyl-tRNA synthetase